MFAGYEFYTTQSLLFNNINNIATNLENISSPLSNNITISLPINTDITSMTADLQQVSQNLNQASIQLGNTATSFIDEYNACQSTFSFFDVRCWVASAFLEIGNSLQTTSTSLSSAGNNLGMFATSLTSLGGKLSTVSVPLGAELPTAQLGLLAQNIKQTESYLSYLMNFLIIYILLLNSFIILIGISIFVLTLKVEKLSKRRK